MKFGEALVLVLIEISVLFIFYRIFLRYINRRINLMEDKFEKKFLDFETRLMITESKSSEISTRTSIAESRIADIFSLFSPVITVTSLQQGRPRGRPPKNKEIVQK